MAHRFGMAVDLDRCTGCEACVTACHAENNIATVGELQASRGRALHWIRVERYFEGEFPDVKVKYRPVMCQQCDAAPCEPVCPPATVRTRVPTTFVSLISSTPRGRNRSISS
jgi:molybdopterin-containing oxidoreductase family iron-sulfur binding subunit